MDRKYVEMIIHAVRTGRFSSYDIAFLKGGWEGVCWKMYNSGNVKEMSLREIVQQVCAATGAHLFPLRP